MPASILGVILARGGSKGLPGKNLLPLGDTSLLGLAIRAARESHRLSRTILSTEDAALREEGLAHGAEVPFERPASLATDNSSTWDVIRHAVEWLERDEGWHADTVVVLQPTTPFRRGHHIDAVIDRLVETGAPACLTVKPVDYPPQWMFRRDAEGFVRPYTDGDWPARRQDAATIYQPNGMVYALVRDRLAEDHPMTLPGTQSVVVEPGISINIDEWWHYELAKILWARLNVNA